MINCLKPCGLIKGVRHILDVESDDWITRDDVNKGLSVLEKHGLTYDLLVRYAFYILMYMKKYSFISRLLMSRHVYHNDLKFSDS